jgi:DNA-binding MarR family transcriptional regulator
MGELAKHMMLSVSSLTTLVDKLVDKKLVQRERAQDDRRVVRVALTRLGHRLHARGRKHRLRMARAMLEALNEQEQDQFLTLATKIGDTARAADRDAENPCRSTKKA